MIILASTSPTRQSMLMNAGLSFSAVAPDVDEREVVAQNPQWTPEDTALRLAEAKAADVSRRNPGAFVIGADQVLAQNGKAYAKPRDAAHCREQLLELRGKTHSLISAIVCARDGRITWRFSDHALLTMRNFSEAFVDLYLEKIGSDCTSSVGGYKVEGPGIQLFDAVKGDHFTILGLPLIPLLDYLRREGEIPA